MIKVNEEIFNAIHKESDFYQRMSSFGGKGGACLNFLCQKGYVGPIITAVNQNADEMMGSGRRVGNERV